MKVLKGVLTNHTVSNTLPKEVRFYATTVEDVKAGDIFAVWAHSELTYVKVTDVFEKYNYLKAENGGVDFEHLPLALNRIDFDAYKDIKEKRAKKDRLVACLNERIAEGTKNAEVEKLIKEVSGSAKDEIKALRDEIKALTAEGI
ncbi:MAG: hypothetical protein II453_05310 [Alphaproteobacteria bacterium]|nr:hypothetical protein [Alphaproteobacteria bacterium]